MDFNFQLIATDRINKAYDMLGIIKRKFIYLFPHSFTTLGNSVDKLRYPRSDAYSAEQVLLPNIV